MYETFEHTADLGLRIRAKTLDGLFVDAAKALFSAIVANPDSIRSVNQFKIDIKGDRKDDLLFDWLAELLYTFDTEHVLFFDFEVHLTESGLTATVQGEPIDTDRHELETDIKAITYHQLKVLQMENGWLAEVIVDL